MRVPLPNKWTVLIVDDEPLARSALRVALAAEADFVVVGEAADGHEAVRKVTSLDPDLVLLDVQMPGLDGFRVVREIGPAAMPMVVFVTAFDEHAERAFEVNALDYLVKPWDDERFGRMLQHVRKRLEEGQKARLHDRLVDLLQSVRGEGDSSVEAEKRGGGWVTRLMVREGPRVRFIEAETVDFFEADGDTVIAHRGSRNDRIRTSLRDLEARLDPARFVRIHRSTILNLDALSEVVPWMSGDYEAVLHDGRRLRVSRHYRPKLLRESF
jgi:two-component system LytT family response regulator